MPDFPLAKPSIGSVGWGPAINANWTTLDSAATKAWVSFYWNGSSIVVRNGYNVSSVTRTTTGDYTINFSTAFANANYIVLSNCDNTAWGNGATSGIMGGTTPAVGSVRIFTHKSSVGPFDPTYVMVTCLGNS